ncbi:MAG: glycosyltransferase family 39 protein [Saprospiraceae bacterium]|nr:glycosyltransferase family 39 protein [Saprospiraceae bacterium]
MSKHRKPAPRPAAAPSRAANAPKQAIYQPPTIVAADFFKRTLLQSGLIFALAFLLYANTLTHGFVLDDSIVINDNMFTQKGTEGIAGILTKDTFFGYFKVEGKAELVMGGRYRPLTLMLFALVFQFFGENSVVFHLLTVLLFAATCVVLYRTLLLLFVPRFGADYSLMLAWMAAVLFAVHPIHVEVVANIKGCDEIATLLGSLGALYFTLKFFDTRKVAWALAAGISFFLACLSKENAVTFLAVVPLALWFFRPLQAAQRQAGPPVWKYALPLLVAFVVFFVIRGNVLHWPKLVGGRVPMELMNNPFLKIEGNEWVPWAFSEKLATVFFTLLKYVQLLFVPHPLTHDYYPKQIEMLRFGSPGALLGLALYVFLAIYALSGLRRRDPVRFGILFYLLTISIVSNIVFPVGTLMGDRFVFMPSVGFCIAVAALLIHYFGKNMQVALGIFGMLALLYSFKTVTRNPAWASNEKLFFTDVKVSLNSAKIHNACGGVLFDRASKEQNEVERSEICTQAMMYLNKAIQLYPNYKDAYMSRGGCNYYLKNYDAAVEDYRRAWQLAEGDPKIKKALALVLRDGGKYHGEQRGDLRQAMTYLSESWQLNTEDGETARLLGVANGVQGKGADAVMWFEKSVALEPDNATYWFDLHLAYRAVGNAAKGEDALRKALALNPKIMEERGRK